MNIAAIAPQPASPLTEEVADLSDPAVKDQVAVLAAIRDQARADADRVASLVEGFGASVTPDTLRRFAQAA